MSLASIVSRGSASMFTAAAAAVSPSTIRGDARLALLPSSCVSPPPSPSPSPSFALRTGRSRFLSTTSTTPSSSREPTGNDKPSTPAREAVVGTGIWSWNPTMSATTAHAGRKDADGASPRIPGQQRTVAAAAAAAAAPRILAGETPSRSSIRSSFSTKRPGSKSLGATASRSRKGNGGRRLEGKDQSAISCAKVTKGRSAILDAKENGCGGDFDEPLGLEKALPRRTDWTPTKSRQAAFVDLTSVTPTSSTPGIEGIDGVIDRTASFKSMVESFGFVMHSGATKATSEGALRPLENPRKPPLKRRKVELATKTPAKDKITPAKRKKEKAPKKKAATITELATKDYIPIENVEERSLMEGFLLEAPLALPSAEGEDQTMQGEVSSKVTASKEKHRKANAQRGRSAAAAKSRLMSPERAIELAESQEFLFGTSSQLVREESPSFLRDLQHALRESEATASQKYVQISQGRDTKRSQSLWEAATRDVDGSLLEVEASAFTESLQRKTPFSVSRHNSGAFRTTPVLCAASTGADVAADVALLPSRDSEAALTPSRGLVSLDFGDAPLVSLPKSMAEAACRTRLPSAPPKKKVAPKQKSSTPARARKSSKELPPEAETDFSKWTVAQLSEKARSYGFKPMRKKAALVELLQKCSASLVGRDGAQPSVTSGISLPQASAMGDAHAAAKEDDNRLTLASDAKPLEEATIAAPKKRGRPRKFQLDADQSSAVVGNREHSPTPPCRALGQGVEKVVDPVGVIDQVSGQMGSSTTDPTADSTADPDADPNAALLAAISCAIAAAPATHDPRAPSWRERLLMYDPIVLEDLTVWLNTEGLGAVGVDEEVWPALVRAWCEARSVCCLWRENLRGGMRSRY